MAIRPFNAFHQYTKNRPENQSQPNPHQPPKPAPGPAEVFDLAAKAVQAGYRVTQAELQERTGYALEPAQGACPGGLEEWRLGGLASPLRGAGPTAPQSPWSVEKSPTLNRRPSVSPSGPRRPSGPSPEPAADSPGGLAALAEALQADCAPLTHALQTLLDQAQQPEGTGRGAEPHPETTHDSRFVIHDLRREAAALAARLPELLPEDPELAAQIRTLLDDTFAQESEGAEGQSPSDNHLPFTAGGHPSLQP